MKTDDIKKAMTSEREMDAYLETRDGAEIIAEIQLLLSEAGGGDDSSHSSMTRRQRLAGMAMQGQITYEGMEGCEPTHIAAMAFELADAMLAAEKGGK